MGDLAEYVEHATDSMNEGSYSELDSFVFSQLVYTKYESPDIMWTQAELENGITVKEFAQKMVSQGQNSMDANEKAFLEAISHSERYENCVIKNMAACDGTKMWDSGRTSTLKDDAQWGAMTIEMNDGSGAEVIAMRGTTDSTLAWSEDLELGYERYGTTAERLSRDYLSSSDAGKIYMAGHSKGGNDCSSAYMMSEQDVRDRVVRIDNFDGPGHIDEFIAENQAAYAELNNKQHNYYPKDSVVGQLLHNNPGTSQFVETEDVGLMDEHVLYNWKINKDGRYKYNGFEDAGGQSELSKALDRVIDANLGGLSSGEKANVMNAIIKAGIPALIAGKGDFQYLDYSSFQAFVDSILQMKGLSPIEIMAALSMVRGLLEELVKYNCIRAIDFIIPNASDFYYNVKNWVNDLIRKGKNALGDFLNLLIYGDSKNIPKEVSGYNPPDSVHQMYDFRNDNQGVYGSSVVLKSCFSINCDILRQDVQCLKSIQKDLFRIKGGLEQLTKNGNGEVQHLIEKSLNCIMAKVDENASEVLLIGDTLESIMGNYQNAEKAILAVHS